MRDEGYTDRCECGHLLDCCRSYHDNEISARDEEIEMLKGAIKGWRSQSESLQTQLKEAKQDTAETNTKFDRAAGVSRELEIKLQACKKQLSEARVERDDLRAIVQSLCDQKKTGRFPEVE